MASHKIRLFLIGITLFAGILFFILTDIMWLKADTLIQFSDPLFHRGYTEDYYLRVRSMRSISDLGNLFSVQFNYPPFFHFSTIPSIAIFGITSDSFVYVNFFYIVVLILSVFGIGNILFDERVGILSAFLVMLYPVVTGLSRQYYIDFALLAMVSLVQYLILKSRGGIKKHWNIALGVAAGFALLTKTHGVIFFLPVWITVLLLNYSGKDNLLSFSTALIIGLIIAAPWHVIAFKDIVAFSGSTIKCAMEYNVYKGRDLFQCWSWYILRLYGQILTPMLTIAFIAGVISFLFFDARRQVVLILLSWIIPSCVLLTLWLNQDDRFIVSVLPAFAIFTMGGICKIPLRPLRNVVCGIVIAAALLQFAENFLELPHLPHFVFRGTAASYCPKPVTTCEDKRVILGRPLPRYYP
jgi:4-amino-4-deoxy-L-arabinose transferase-like glycosyltransferase